MPRQLSTEKLIEYLSGLRVGISQSLEDPNAAWGWELSIYGPESNGKLVSWAEDFRRDWLAFSKNKKFLAEIALIEAFGQFTQRRYFDLANLIPLQDRQTQAPNCARDKGN